MIKFQWISNPMVYGCTALLFVCIFMHVAGCSKSEKSTEILGRWELDVKSVPGGFPIKLPGAGGNITKYRIDITEETLTFRVDADLNEFGSSTYSLQSPWKYDGQILIIKDINGKELRITAKKSADGILTLGSHPGALTDLIFKTEGSEEELKRNAAARELLKAFEAATNQPINLIKKQEKPKVGDTSSP